MSCLNSTRNKSFLVSVFLISLLLRAVLFFGFLQKGENYLVYFDSAQYQTIAHNIAEGNGIAVSQGVPNFYRLPGYPFFMACCYKIYEKMSPPLHRDHLVVVIQLVLGSLLPVLIFCLSNILLPNMPGIAIWCALIAAFHLGFVLYSGIIATELLFTLFFLIFLMFFFQKKFVLSGLALGLASLIRPVGHFILPVALLLILFLNSERSRSQRLFDAGFLIFSWLIMVAWWLVRNWLLTGMIFFHTLPGLHFLQYTTAKIVMDLRDCSYVEARGALLDEWKEAITQKERLSGRVISEPETCVLAEKITWSYFCQRPLVAVKNGVCEMMKTVLGLYSAQMVFSDAQEWGDYDKESKIWEKIKKYLFPRVKTWYLIPLVWYDILCSLFLLIGFFIFCLTFLTNRQAYLLGVKIVPFMFLFVGLTLAYGCARLRLPFEPLLIIASCFGWAQVLAVMWRKQNA